MLVLTCLFAWSIYFVDPERVHGRGIALLEAQVTATLEPDAQDKKPQVTSAFQALAALNETGQMQWRDLAKVVQSYRELGADGGLDADDTDALIATIRDLVMDRTRPRSL
jgi:hypothetical protein